MMKNLREFLFIAVITLMLLEIYPGFAGSRMRYDRGYGYGGGWGGGYGGYYGGGGWGGPGGPYRRPYGGYGFYGPPRPYYGRGMTVVVG